MYIIASIITILLAVLTIVSAFFMIRKFTNAENVMIISYLGFELTSIVVLYPAAFSTPNPKKINIEIKREAIDTIIEQINDQSDKKTKNLNFVSIFLAIIALFTQGNTIVLSLLIICFAITIIMAIYNFSVISSYKTYLMFSKNHNETKNDNETKN